MGWALNDVNESGAGDDVPTGIRLSVRLLELFFLFSINRVSRQAWLREPLTGRWRIETQKLE